MADSTSTTFSSYCLAKFQLPARFHHVISGCLSTFPDNAACCGDQQYYCNNRNGLIYFIATDVDFHAAFVRNMCRQQNLCEWSFLNLFVRDVRHQSYSESSFWFLPAIAYEIWRIVGEFTHSRLKLIHEVDNKNNFLILTVVLLKMRSSEIWASDSAISVKNEVLELTRVGHLLS